MKADNSLQQELPFCTTWAQVCFFSFLLLPYAERFTAPEVSVDLFCKSVLPGIDDAKVERIHAALVTNRTITGNDWSGFTQEPKDQKFNKKRDEGRTFAPLKDLLFAIIATASEGDPKLACESNGSRTPFSRRRSDTSRPDGWIKVTPSRLPPPKATSTRVVDWGDIVCSFEFKLLDNRDNRHDVSAFLLINVIVLSSLAH